MRRAVVGIAALAFIALQWTIAVHACSIGVTGSTSVPAAQVAASVDDSVAMHDCGQTRSTPAAGGRICAAHCQVDAQVDAGDITLVAPIAPQPALSISLAAPILPRFAATSPLLARGAAPPLLALFSRLLI